LTLEKCEFHEETVRYLRLSESTKGISMDENKVETIQTSSQEKKTINRRLIYLVEAQHFFG